MHDVLYLMFNEGHSTSRGANPIRDELCEEALRLCHVLCEHELGTKTTYAMLALMIFHAARLESRVDADGAVVLLEDQDRKSWDPRLIGVGERWLQKSGDPISRFHLEAGIALLHCRASSVDTTNWAAIVRLYEQLGRHWDSPLYTLNRALARAQAGDVETAFEELASIRDHPDLANYYLLDCAEARLHELSGDRGAAVACYRRALGRDVADHERALLERKIRKTRQKGDDRGP